MPATYAMNAPKARVVYLWIAREFHGAYGSRRAAEAAYARFLERANIFPETAPCQLADTEVTHWSLECTLDGEVADDVFEQLRAGTYDGTIHAQ